MVHLLLIIIYIAFISLGLPDAVLGAAWPSIYPVFQVPVSYAGIITIIIAFCTILSSLQSDRLTLKFGTGKVMVASVAMTALALFGFSVSDAFWKLCLWAIPYGFGAGSVDASLNNYVALHYESKHMSWLHCMWGIGATTGPYVLGYVLSQGMNWNKGYFVISMFQIVLTIILFVSLPLWRRRDGVMQVRENTTEASGKSQELKPLSLSEVLRIKGAKEIMITFFCYCALEQTAMLWSASYLNLHNGIDAETAASLASMFFIGLTVGRALSGFVTMKLNDTQMIRLGQGIIGVGILVMLIPLTDWLTFIGLMLIGLGCAPIYPCVIHSTPDRFGAEKSQAIIGVQMAFAYIGTLAMPPIFGLIANHVDIGLLPIYLLVILVLMVVMFQRLTKVAGE